MNIQVIEREAKAAKRTATPVGTAVLPRYRRAGEQAPPMLLTSRDLAVLEDMWRFRFLTTSQLEMLRACDPREEHRFVSRLTLTRRLKLLFHHRYLRRIPRPQAQGSREPVYMLDAEGARVLSRQHGEVKASPPSRLPKAAALDHLLDIVQVRLSLATAFLPDHTATTKWPGNPAHGIQDAADSSLADYRLLEWLPGEKARFRVVLEEAGRRRQSVSLIPDGMAMVRLSGYRHYAFVEVDRATEPLRTIAEKGRAYLAYWQSGGFARDFSVPPGLGFRVLLVAPSSKRAQTLLKAVSSLPQPRQLFRVGLAEEVRPERVLQAVWRDGASGQPVTPFGTSDGNQMAELRRLNRDLNDKLSSQNALVTEHT